MHNEVLVQMQRQADTYLPDIDDEGDSGGRDLHEWGKLPLRTPKKDEKLAQGSPTRSSEKSGNSQTKDPDETTESQPPSYFDDVHFWNGLKNAEDVNENILHEASLGEATGRFYERFYKIKTQLEDDDHQRQSLFDRKRVFVSRDAAVFIHARWKEKQKKRENNDKVIPYTDFSTEGLLPLGHALLVETAACVITNCSCENNDSRSELKTQVEDSKGIPNLITKLK
jgi:hypothetical protein